METDILGRIILIEQRDESVANEVIYGFVTQELATLEDVLYYNKYAEYIIGNCDEEVFRDICSELVARRVKLC